MLKTIISIATVAGALTFGAAALSTPAAAHTPGISFHFGNGGFHISHNNHRHYHGARRTVEVCKTKRVRKWSPRRHRWVTKRIKRCYTRPARRHNW